MQQLFLLAILSAAILVSGTPGQGTFTVNCVPLTIQRADPIVTPGEPGGHVHSIIGGNAFQRQMGPMDGNKLANETTCDKAIDHSNYWVPIMYHYREADKLFELVPWHITAVYYQIRACNYSATARTCDPNVVPLAFPYGFRMIAGDPLRRTFNASDKAQDAVSFACLGEGGRYNGLPPHRCNLMRAQVYFPSCWDGKNLDSPDHKSHVSYPAVGNYNGGVCPESHPVALLSIFYEFMFDTSGFTDTKFVFANGDATGYGYHGDFVMGWTDRDLLQTAHRDCLGPSDCPKLGNQHYQPRPLLFPAIYDEEIGLNGPIATLPGNNPVVWPTK